MLLPLAAQPLFDAGTVVEEAFFQVQQGAGEGGGEMGNHGELSPGRRNAVVVETAYVTKTGRPAAPTAFP
ncbi:hypothetical protein AZSP09_23110 [Azospira sp. I09]|nr:hypothetical protein AZSP09_23110 [Azospira sp. I09]